MQVPARGFVRIRGRGKPLLVGYNTIIEVCQADGSWVPLKGVTVIDVRITPDEIATATLSVGVTELDVQGLEPIVHIVDKRSLWQRLVTRVYYGSIEVLRFMGIIRK